MRKEGDKFLPFLVYAYYENLTNKAWSCCWPIVFMKWNGFKLCDRYIFLQCLRQNVPVIALSRQLCQADTNLPTILIQILCFQATNITFFFWKQAYQTFFYPKQTYTGKKKYTCQSIMYFTHIFFNIIMIIQNTVRNLM